MPTSAAFVLALLLAAPLAALGVGRRPTQSQVETASAGFAKTVYAIDMTSPLPEQVVVGVPVPAEPAQPPEVQTYQYRVQEEAIQTPRQYVVIPSPPAQRIIRLQPGSEEVFAGQTGEAEAGTAAPAPATPAAP